MDRMGRHCQALGFGQCGLPGVPGAQAYKHFSKARGLILKDVILLQQLGTRNLNLRPEWAWGSRCSIITLIRMENVRMCAVRANVGSALFGKEGQIGVNRGLGEFHAGRPVLISGGGETLLTLPVEGLDAQRLAEFVALCAPVVPRLVITARRALALGLDATTPVALNFTAGLDVDIILALVADAKIDRPVDVKAAGPAASAAIELVKLSQGLPAVLVADVVAGGAIDHHIITVEAEAVARFGDETIRSLAIASKASVPLNSGARADFIVFRDAMGGSPVAIIVCKPDFSLPVLVRLHSACLTGDVFGSRRCDCGDQLNLALKRLEEIGGGVVLYLPQEGRGLGLANKMRT